MGNLPDTVRYIDPIDDFQVVCKRITPENSQVGATFSVTRYEKALFVNTNGQTIGRFSEQGKTINPDVRDIWVASLRKFHTVMGFGDTSESPYSESPSKIHAKDESFQTNDGEEIRSATVSITCCVDSEDRPSIDKLLEIKPEKFGIIYVKDIMRELNSGLSISIKDKIAGVESTTGETSIKTDEIRKTRIIRAIHGESQHILENYGIAVENVQLNIVLTSRDTSHRLGELDKEAKAEHGAKIKRIERDIEESEKNIASLKKRAEEDKLENQRVLSRELLHTKILELQVKQAEYKALMSKYTKAQRSTGQPESPAQMPNLHKLILRMHSPQSYWMR